MTEHNWVHNWWLILSNWIQNLVTDFLNMRKKWFSPFHSLYHAKIQFFFFVVSSLRLRLWSRRNTDFHQCRHSRCFYWPTFSLTLDLIVLILMIFSSWWCLDYYTGSVKQRSDKDFTFTHTQTCIHTCTLVFKLNYKFSWRNKVSSLSHFISFHFSGFLSSSSLVLCSSVSFFFQISSRSRRQWLAALLSKNMIMH